MKSKIDGRKYAILAEWMDKPVRINKKETDDELKKLSRALTNLADVLHGIYSNNEDLYHILKESFFDSDISEGHSWRLDHAKRTCDDLIQELAENDDDIREELYYTTLKDLGFEPDFHANFRWEKVVEDTNEKEVVEEVVFLNKILHRKRTIIWEEIEHGKSSKEIIYESLKIDKRLRTIVENTRRIYNIKERK